MSFECEMWKMCHAHSFACSFSFCACLHWWLGLVRLTEIDSATRKKDCATFCSLTTQSEGWEMRNCGETRWMLFCRVTSGGMSVDSFPLGFRYVNVFCQKRQRGREKWDQGVLESDTKVLPLWERNIVVAIDEDQFCFHFSFSETPVTERTKVESTLALTRSWIVLDRVDVKWDESKFGEMSPPCEVLLHLRPHNDGHENALEFWLVLNHQLLLTLKF